MTATNSKLRVAVISDGFPLWPLHVARAGGMFEAEALDVAITVTGASARQMEALERGEFDVGIQLPDHVVRAAARGSDLVAFMAPVHAPDISLVAVPGLRSLGELGGRVIAVDGARSGYALLLRRMLRAQGISDSDCQLVEFGGTQERLQALTEGRASAAFINPPFDRILLDQRFVRLTSTLTAFPNYPGPVAAARRGWAQENTALLVRFVRAYRHALKWMTDPRNREAAIAIACARLPVNADMALVAWQELVSRGEPVLCADGFEQVVDVVWESEGFDPPKPSADRFIDLRYIEAA